MKNIEKINIPIKVEKVKNVNEEYFLQNKTYIEKVNAERVIYLDVDTIVVDKIDKVWKKAEEEEEVIAKRDSSMENRLFGKREWNEILSTKKAKKGPYLNSGFVIFQKKSHKEISKEWKKECGKGLADKEIKNFQGEKMIEQVTLSISILKKKMSILEMKKNEHVFGWKVDPYSSNLNKECVVYHTGSRGDRHIKYASILNQRGLIDLNTPSISTGVSPLHIRLQMYDIAYRIKHTLLG